ncbi:uncharacterized protein ACR2FA_000754 [Aphomia sociella]
MVTSTVQGTSDNTNSNAASAADKDTSIVGSVRDTISNTYQNTVDTTKNVATSAYEKGTSFVGSAKDTVTSTVYGTVDNTDSNAASADKDTSIVGSVRGTSLFYFLFYIYLVICFILD